MTFYEKELRKIMEPQFPEATFVGRACYVRLSDINRAKIQFISTNIASHYDALRLTILNRKDGEVDNLLLRFSDLLGKKMTTNPNFRDGIMPYIWDDHGKADWYVYHPTQRDYAALTAEVSEYLGVFMEQAQTADRQWQQTM